MQFEAAKKYQLKDSVEYAVESIVSKKIIQNTGGNISLFAFEKGEGLAEHSSPYAAVVQVLEGKVDISIDGKSHHLSMGELIILPENVPHALYALDRFKMMLTMIKS